MIVGSVEKQPAETFLVGNDFGPDLATGETITGQTVTAKNERTGVDSSAVILSGGPVLSGTTMSHRIAGGVDGERHIVQIRITTSQSNTYEAEIRVMVRER